MPLASFWPLTRKSTSETSLLLQKWVLVFDFFSRVGNLWLLTMAERPFPFPRKYSAPECRTFQFVFSWAIRRSSLTEANVLESYGAKLPFGMGKWIMQLNRCAHCEPGNLCTQFWTTSSSSFTGGFSSLRSRRQALEKITMSSWFPWSFKYAGLRRR